MAEISKEDFKKTEDSVTQILKFIGEDPEREGLKKTPYRVAKSYVELCSGYAEDPAKILSTTFSDSCDEMVVVRDIRFWSLCEHHMLPFHGVATIGYLPKDRIVGLSKIGRLVHCFARRLQVQERMTQQIANSIMENLNPHGVGVILKATHLCMEMRGVRTSAEMVTSCLLGQFRDAITREEFLAMKQSPYHYSR